MNKGTIILFTVIFTFCSCVGINACFKNSSAVNNSAQNSRINLVIDAGHGGIDAGTIGVDGAKEKDINLNIALKLYDFVRISGVNVHLFLFTKIILKMKKKTACKYGFHQMMIKVQYLQTVF